MAKRLFLAGLVVLFLFLAIGVSTKAGGRASAQVSLLPESEASLIRAGCPNGQICDDNGSWNRCYEGGPDRGDCAFGPAGCWDPFADCTRCPVGPYDAECDWWLSDHHCTYIERTAVCVFKYNGICIPDYDFWIGWHCHCEFDSATQINCGTGHLRCQNNE